MSLDRSLKSKSALVRSRSVLTRSERIAKMIDQERWDSENSVFGLPKIAVKRRTRKSKSKAKEEATATEADTGAEAKAAK